MQALDKARAALLYLQRLPLQAQVTVATAALLCVLLVVAVTSPLLSVLFDSARQVSNLEPRIARTLGFEASGDVLATNLELVEREVELYTWDAAENLASLGAELQQTTRKMAEGAGLTVNGSQLLPSEERERTNLLRVNLELSGSPQALDAFLEELDLNRPLMLVETIRILPARQLRGVTSDDLTVSARVVTFRLREAS